MFTDAAVFCSTSPICRATDMKMLLKTSRRAARDLPADLAGRGRPGGGRLPSAPAGTTGSFNPGAPARLDERGRSGLAHDCRAGNAVAGNQILPPVDRRPPPAAGAVDALRAAAGL